MHTSAYDFVTRVLAHDNVTGKRVLEVGALDVNGSVRPYVTSLRPAEYIGVDKRKGRRVDRRVAAESLVAEFGLDAFDVVLCIETLEHVHAWRVALWSMVAVLRTSGMLVLTTRAPGFPRHDHPDDWWRFTGQDFLDALAPACRVAIAPDPAAPGVFVLAVKQRTLTLPHLDTIHATRAPQ